MLCAWDVHTCVHDVCMTRGVHGRGIAISEHDIDNVPNRVALQCCSKALQIIHVVCMGCDMTLTMWCAYIWCAWGVTCHGVLHVVCMRRNMWCVMWCAWDVKRVCMRCDMWYAMTLWYAMWFPYADMNHYCNM